MTTPPTTPADDESRPEAALTVPRRPPAVGVPDDLQDDLAAAMELAEASVAKSTEDVYGRAFNRFAVWAEGKGLTALPAAADTVAAYLGLMHRRNLSPSRMAVVLAAIGWRHKRANQPDPTRDERLTMVMAGKRRKDAGRPKRKARPLLAAADGGLPGEIHALAAAVAGDDLVAKRDRALVLLGFAGAFRRSELAALTLGDLEATPKGLLVTVRKGKGDQEGRGLVKAVVPGATHCPVRALLEWLDALEAATGRAAAAADGKGDLPVFVPFTRPRVEKGPDGTKMLVPVPRCEPMSDQTVVRVLKRRAAAAGLDPERISGHSLRSGLVTSAAQQGKDVLRIQALTGHKTLSILAEYVHLAGLFDGSAGEGLL